MTIFAGGGFFPKNRALSWTSPNRPLTPYKVSEKTNDPIPRKHLERRMDGWMDGRTEGQNLIHGILPATAEGPKKQYVKDKTRQANSLIFMLVFHSK